MFSAWENEEELAQLDDMVCYENKHRKQEPPIDMIIMGVTPDADTEY